MITDSLAIQVIDLLHPLATIHWEEWFKSSLLKTRTFGTRRILFKGKPYLFTNDGILMYGYDRDSLEKVKLPTKGLYGISTYRSQIVLVGGLDPTTQLATNKVWVSDDGSKWEPSLPPLPIAHEKPLVVNTGNPEYLIVIGGRINEESIDVHVLIGEQWMWAQPLPLNSSRRPRSNCSVKFSAHTIHNWNLLILRRLTPSFYCNLDTLLATVTFEKTSNSSKSLWRVFEMPSSSYHLLSLKNCVITAGGIHPSDLSKTIGRIFVGRPINRTPKICAYSPLTRTWVQVGDIPYSYQRSIFSETSSGAYGSLFLLGGELVFATAHCQEGSDNEQRILRASVKSKQCLL